MAYSRQNKSGFAEFEIPYKPILIVALLGSGLFILLGFTRKVSDALGITKTDEEKAESDRYQKNEKDKFGTQGQTTKSTSNGIPSTKTKSEWVSIADMVYEYGKYTSLDDKKSELAYQVCRVKNTTDYWELFNAFGTRQEYMFGISSGDKQDLKAFVRNNVTSAQLAVINDNYRRKSISQTY